MCRKMITILLSFSMIWGGLCTHVSASMINTQQALSMETRSLRIANIESQLARQDVQLALVGLGVDPEQARMRVASLTDEELQQLDGQLESLPAGGMGALALIGAVFVVLLILELTGVINVFKGA